MLYSPPEKLLTREVVCGFSSGAAEREAGARALAMWAVCARGSKCGTVLRSGAKSDAEIFSPVATRTKVAKRHPLNSAI